MEVEIEEDLDPRVVEVPPDLKATLEENPEAEIFFNQLSYTHQGEYVQWIEGAKREQTRQARVARAVEMLKDKKREF